MSQLTITVPADVLNVSPQIEPEFYSDGQVATEDITMSNMTPEAHAGHILHLATQKPNLLHAIMLRRRARAQTAQKVAKAKAAVRRPRSSSAAAGADDIDHNPVVVARQPSGPARWQLELHRRAMDAASAARAGNLAATAVHIEAADGVAAIIGMDSDGVPAIDNGVPAIMDKT